MLKVKDIKNSDLKEWLDNHSKICKVPQLRLIYSPQRGNSFSLQGEEMVNSLTKIGYPVFNIFKELLSLNEQKELATTLFESFKGTPFDKPGKKGKLGYFRTKRTFGSLVPQNYQRTPKAPRLTVKGNSFHGMMKAFLIEIVKEITKRNNEFLVIEFDMSACHSRVASSLLPSGNLLDTALHAQNFWDEQVDKYLPRYEKKGIEMNKKVLKRMLKVGLYTALNGGNPSSHDRLIDNLSSNAITLLPAEKIRESDIYIVTNNLMDDFSLLKEVKDLNKKCFYKGLYNSFTYTIDKTTPYKNEASYKGISRVLQGFEVVLLSALTKEIVELDGIPLSLDHDGLMVLFVLEEPNLVKEESLNEEIKEIEEAVTQSLKGWSHYLLGSTVPIEAKRHWFQGKVVEY